MSPAVVSRYCRVSSHGSTPLQRVSLRVALLSLPYSSHFYVCKDKDFPWNLQGNFKIIIRRYHYFKDRFLLSRSGESIAKPHFDPQVKELLYLAHRLGASVIHLPSSFLHLLWPRSECGVANSSYLLHHTSSISHQPSYIFRHSAYPVEFSTLALTDIRDEPREAVSELGGQGCYGARP